MARSSDTTKRPTGGRRRAGPVATLGDVAVPAEVARRLRKVRKRLAVAAEHIARGVPVPSESPERLELIARRAALRGRVPPASAPPADAPKAPDEPPAQLPVRAEDLPTQERIIGRDDLLPIGFFARGLIAARAVGRIVVMGGAEHATGFLVAPDMLMTNHHVLPDEARAAVSEVQFELHDGLGRIAETRLVELDPGRFFFADEALDVAVVALAEGPEMREATEDLGWHPMIAQQGKIRIGDPVNLIQHPGGRGKSVAVHNSNLLHLENGTDLTAFLWYSSDTEQGSSGAPVFNSQWEVVGVHHRGVPDTNAKGELVDAEGKVIGREAFRSDPSLAVWIANEGTRTSRIVGALEAADCAGARLTRTRDALLARWEESRLRNHGQAAAARARDAGLMTESARGGRPAPGATTLRAGGVTVQITVNPEAG